MKRLVVAGMGNGSPDDSVSPVFGRCGTFCVVDLSGNKVKTSTVISNEAVDRPGSAGLIAADSVVKLGADAVVAGDFGRMSTRVFMDSGIKQYIIRNATVSEAIERMISGGGRCLDSQSVMSSERPDLGRRSIHFGTAVFCEKEGSFICKSCGCTMPRKRESERVYCPNCGNIME
ncbi:putative Fe-Mo cluster-binding NifX family protein [Methanomicrobium sp. W14]|uniref:NifB/NifX family molybdenum-iron cluster-binding protein n=1 Tax=Methanomicrobium sp. W14 TaxID=2817839 RepID=UPI001AE41841|nr:NifB/NifX family molybdenum-iron cluster-binding protein [Methanomicrobium sp. W14]MBP2134568.1 putative Fe-Mo cluster-binding NifX family protein [Methanomicrobium sp. W14]